MNLAEMLRKAALRRAAAGAGHADVPAQRGEPPAPFARRLTPDAAYADGRDTIHFTQFFRAQPSRKAAAE